MYQCTIYNIHLYNTNNKFIVNGYDISPHQRIDWQFELRRVLLHRSCLYENLDCGNLQPILSAIYSDWDIHRQWEERENYQETLQELGILSPVTLFSSNMQGYDDIREDFEVVQPLINELHAFTWPSSTFLLSEW